MTNSTGKALTNAEKQQRYRDRQKQSGKKELRGYLTAEALSCYEEIQQKTAGKLVISGDIPEMQF